MTDYKVLAEDARQAVNYLRQYAALKNWPRLNDCADVLQACDRERQEYAKEQAAQLEYAAAGFARAERAEALAQTYREALETVANWSSTSAIEHGHIGVTEFARRVLDAGDKP